MKKPVTKSTTISIATLLVVFVVAIGLILANNYRKNSSTTPPSTPIAYTQVETKGVPTNTADIAKLYLIDSTAELKRQFKISALTNFDPESQVLVGAALPAKATSIYDATIESVATRDNQVLINYRVTHPEDGTGYAAVRNLFVTINRTDLPNFSQINFVFTNLTDGATQTITKSLGAE